MTLDPRSFAILEPAKNINYVREELFSARDEQIRDLLLHAADRATVDQVAGMVPAMGDLTLTAFAERAASIAVRHQDARELRAGIYAVVLTQAITGDPQEPLPAMALLYRAAEMIGHNPGAEFFAANELTGGHAGGLLDFLRRSPADRTIKTVGYEEGNDKWGFRFLHS